MSLGCNIPYLMEQGKSRTMLIQQKQRSRTGHGSGGVARIKSNPMDQWLTYCLFHSLKLPLVVSTQERLSKAMNRDLLPVGCILNTSLETGREDGLRFICPTRRKLLSSFVAPLGRQVTSLLRTVRFLSLSELSFTFSPQVFTSF